MALLAFIFVSLTAAAPQPAAAESVTGKKYSVYIYSRYVAEPATTITFKSDGVLLMSTYSGFGSYYAFANGVGAFFSAPEVEKNKDLFMLMVGLLLGDFLSGAGITFTNGAFSEVFFFSGYVIAG
jgi:hypothetical protein